MSMLDEVPCPVLVTDREGLVQTVNKNLLAMVGGTEEIWVGLSMDQMFPLASRIFLQTHVWPLLLREGEVREIKLQMLAVGNQRVAIFVNCKRGSVEGGSRFTWAFFVAHERSRFEHELLDARQRAETAAANLVKSERFIRAVTDALPSMIGYWDTDVRCRFANKPYFEWFGKKPDELLGLHMAEAFGDKVYESNLPLVQGVLRGIAQEFERSITKSDGTVGHVLINYAPDRNELGEVKGFFALTTDISSMREADAAIRLSASVFEATTAGIIVTDDQGIIVSVNSAFTTISGYDAVGAIGKSARLFKSDRHEAAFYAEMFAQLVETKHWKGEIWCKRKDDRAAMQSLSITSVVNDTGEIVRYVGVFSDITEQWDHAQTLRKMALHDGLTGLPNRVLLLERIGRLIAISSREPRQIALLFLDLDGFKRVNDTLGHDMGDHVLKTVSTRLLGLLRATDTVARLGGDEFVVLLDNPAGPDTIRQVAGQLIKAVNEPVLLEGKAVHVGTSIGIACYDNVIAMSAQELLKMADVAMYASKAAGKNIYTFAN